MSTELTVRLTRSALGTIRTEALARTDGSETGGILLGHTTENTTAVVIAGTPGPHAIHQPTRFLRDLNHAQELAAEAWRDHRAQWIGEWHTHPQGSAQPSRTDLTSYRRHLQDPELGFTQFLSLIVGATTEVPGVLVAWVITTECVTAATIDIDDDSGKDPARTLGPTQTGST